MITKYKVTRTVTITTTDIIPSDKVMEILDGKSLAGEISELGFGNLHRSVSYSFGDTDVKEVN